MFRHRNWSLSENRESRHQRWLTNRSRVKSVLRSRRLANVQESRTNERKFQERERELQLRRGTLTVPFSLDVPTTTTIRRRNKHGLSLSLAPPPPSVASGIASARAQQLQKWEALMDPRQQPQQGQYSQVWPIQTPKGIRALHLEQHNTDPRAKARTTRTAQYRSGADLTQIASDAGFGPKLYDHGLLEFNVATNAADRAVFREKPQFFPKHLTQLPQTIWLEWQILEYFPYNLQTIWTTLTPQRQFRVLNQLYEQLTRMVRTFGQLGIACFDIRFGNAMVSEKGRVVLIDFDPRWCQTSHSTTGAFRGRTGTAAQRNTVNAFFVLFLVNTMRSLPTQQERQALAQMAFRLPEFRHSFGTTRETYDGAWRQIFAFLQRDPRILLMLSVEEGQDFNLLEPDPTRDARTEALLRKWILTLAEMGRQPSSVLGSSLSSKAPR